MELITTEEVMGINLILAGMYKFQTNLLNLGTLEAAVDRANFGPFYLEESLHARTAFLLRGIAQDHPFLDGNKRTAAVTAVTIYRDHGYIVDTTSGELAAFTLRVAMNEAAYVDISEWLHAHTRKVI